MTTFPSGSSRIVPFTRSLLDDIDSHLLSILDGSRFGQDSNRIYRGSPFSDNPSDILMSDANHDLGTIFFLSVPRL